MFWYLLNLIYRKRESVNTSTLQQSTPQQRIVEWASLSISIATENDFLNSSMPFSVISYTKVMAMVEVSNSC